MFGSLRQWLSTQVSKALREIQTSQGLTKAVRSPVFTQDENYYPRPEILPVCVIRWSSRRLPVWQATYGFFVLDLIVYMWYPEGDATDSVLSETETQFDSYLVTRGSTTDLYFVISKAAVAESVFNNEIQAKGVKFTYEVRGLKK